MNKLLAVSMMGLALGASSARVEASMTMSYNQSGDAQTNQALPGYGGGEFNITPLSGWGANPLAGYVPTTTEVVGQTTAFRSFCLEKNEYTLTGELDVEISGKAYKGGLNTVNQPPGDPISKGTAWLYSQFARGQLSGYNYVKDDPARDTQAGLLQEAIWALEGEISAPANNPYYNAAIAPAVGGTADAPLGYLGVYALNITTTQAGQEPYRQDMLYYAVPEPSTYLAGLGAVGLLGASAVRRRMARSVPAVS